MSGKAKFGSKIGLITATVGSAVGLGNIWRFPSEVQQNGGATFLLVYLICVLALGIPVMLAEFSLGRGGQSDAIGVFKKLSPKTKWWLTGALSMIASYIILSFYIVVAGWTLEYFWQSITGSLYSGTITIQELITKRNEMINTSWNPLIWVFVMICLNLFILLRGIQKGIEKLSNILMPILFAILILFCIISLSLPNAMAGVEYFIKPDFSKLNGTLLVRALGQAFFSLSLGMGVLITYSSYYPKETKLTRTATVVSALDFMVALLMGFIIFPAVESFGLNSDPAGLSGSTLVFITLPEIFAQLPFTRFWSALFFLLLAIAALTSTISLGEVTISLFQDKFKFSRVKSTLIVILPLFLFSSICSLSEGPLAFIRIGGLNIFDFLDTISTNYLLPISSLFLCIYVGWVLPRKFFKDEMTNGENMTSQLFPIIYFLIKYIAPILVAIIIFSQIFHFNT